MKELDGQIATHRAQQAWVQRFRCGDAAHATTLAGKLLADLTLSPRTEVIAIHTAAGEVQATSAPNVVTPGPGISAKSGASGFRVGPAVTGT